MVVALHMKTCTLYVMHVTNYGMHFHHLVTYKLYLALLLCIYNSYLELVLSKVQKVQEIKNNSFKIKNTITVTGLEIKIDLEIPNTTCNTCVISGSSQWSKSFATASNHSKASLNASMWLAEISNQFTERVASDSKISYYMLAVYLFYILALCLSMCCSDVEYPLHRVYNVRDLRKTSLFQWGCVGHRYIRSCNPHDWSIQVIKCITWIHKILRRKKDVLRRSCYSGYCTSTL